jgi:hypothetical protein
MWIAFRDFHGLAPKYRKTPYAIPSGYAQIARNCKLDGGAIKPIKGPSKIITPSKVGTKKTIFLYKDTDPNIWFNWLDDVDVIRSIINGDTTGLCIFTGDGDYPKITNSTYATSGGTGYPEISFKLGCPKPAAAPTVTVIGDAPEESDDEIIEDVTYCYRLVVKWGNLDQEGPLSDASDIVTVSFSFGQSVQLTGLGSAAPGSGWMTTGMVKRIYRMTTGTTGETSGWQFVAEIPLNQETYTDDTETSDLSAEEPDLPNAYPPPDDMFNVMTMPNGIVVGFGFDGKTILMSEPWAPHAFNPDYYKTLDWKIVGGGVFSQYCVVLTEGPPHLLYGAHPSSMTLDKTGINFACTSKRGIVCDNASVRWPCPDGYAEMSANGTDLLTAGLFERNDWMELYAPETINAYWREGWIIGFYEREGVQAGFMFNPVTKEFVDLDLYATAGFNDLIKDSLALQIGNDIVEWDADDANRLTMSYRTRDERIPRPACMCVGQVLAESYPVSFTLHAEVKKDARGKLYMKAMRTLTVYDDKPFNIIGNYKSSVYSVQVSGKNAINWIGIADGFDDLQEALANGT